MVVILVASPSVAATSIEVALLLPSRFQPWARSREIVAGCVVVVVLVTVVAVVVVVVDVVAVTGAEVLVPLKLPLAPAAMFDQLPKSAPEIGSIVPVKLEPVEVEPTVICSEPVEDT